MTAIQEAARTECPPHERPPFKSTVRHLVIAKSIKHYLDTGEAKNMVNRAGVKKFILEWAKYTRYHQFKRIAAYIPAEVNAKVRHTLTTSDPKSLSEAVRDMESVARQKCFEVVRRNPSLGKTLK